MLASNFNCTLVFRVHFFLHLHFVAFFSLMGVLTLQFRSMQKEIFIVFDVGSVFNGIIPVEGKDKLEKAIAQANKRAKKLDLPLIELQYGSTMYVPVYFPNMWDNKGNPIVMFRRECIECTITGTRPVLKEWQFYGYFDIDLQMPIYKGIADLPPLPEYVWQNAKLCQHCNIKRQRSKSFVLQHTATNAFIVVGSSCLQDFSSKMSGIANDPLVACQYLQNLIELQERILFPEFYCSVCDTNNKSKCECIEFSEDRFRSGFDLFELPLVLSYTLESIERHGYKSKKLANETGLPSTVSIILSAILRDEKAGSDYWFDNWKQYDEKYGFQCNYGQWPSHAYILAKHREKVELLLNWAKQLPKTSDYNINLQSIAANNCCKYGALGYACSIPSAYDREFNYNAKQVAIKEQKKESAYFGTIKKRETFELKLIAIKAIDSIYGTTYLHIFEDVDGNKANWFASSCPFGYDDERQAAIGKMHKITGSVKDHSEYKGEKQTILTRCKIAD